jgi:hypothetical protein
MRSALVAHMCRRREGSTVYRERKWVQYSHKKTSSREFQSWMSLKSGLLLVQEAWVFVSST